MEEAVVAGLCARTADTVGAAMLDVAQLHMLEPKARIKARIRVFTRITSCMLLPSRAQGNELPPPKNVMHPSADQRASHREPG